MKILIADKIADSGIALLSEDPEFEVIFKPGLDENGLCDYIQDVDGLIVRSGVSITSRVIAAARNLKVIGRAGIGVDNIDVNFATERGIVVLNTPNANATTTAELAIAHLFSLCRQLPQANESVRAGKWERARFNGVEITGKTLGVIGFGTIGRVVCQRALGLKMNVIAYDPFVTEDVFNDAGVETMSLEELLARADIITLHCPLTANTSKLINSDAISKMKPGARLINCARGGLVDEDALYDALKSGYLSGAALDVYNNEPPVDSPLLELDNIQFTPHLGASTHEAQTAVGLEIAKQIVTFLKTNEAINAINLPRIPAKESLRLKPYQELARKLGRLLSAMCSDAITRLDFTLSGPVVELNTRPVFNDALIGLLEAHLSIAVNQVNANFLAKRQGIQLSESCSIESHDYLTSLSLTAHTGIEAITLSGTLFDERYPRLVRINNYLIEAPLSGHMVFTRHQDKPGVVGDLGALLAKNHINISTMQVGVAESSEHAIAVIGVSNPLDENMLAELRELPAISRVLQITL